MKEKIKSFLSGIGLMLLIGAGVDLATNYTSQQIDNMTFNPTDSTVNVNIKGSGIVTNQAQADTAAYFKSDSVLNVNDTINFLTHYAYRFKFSLFCDSRLTFKLIGTDTAYIPANGTVSMDYLNINDYNKLVIKSVGSGGITTPAFYSIISQGL